MHVWCAAADGPGGGAGRRSAGTGAERAAAPEGRVQPALPGAGGLRLRRRLSVAASPPLHIHDESQNVFILWHFGDIIGPFCLKTVAELKPDENWSNLNEKQRQKMDQI